MPWVFVAFVLVCHVGAIALLPKLVHFGLKSSLVLFFFAGDPAIAKCEERFYGRVEEAFQDPLLQVFIVYHSQEEIYKNLLGLFVF